MIDEQIDATTRTFLGLTVSCARCHDHKFDPIPTRDYYAMAGIFRSTDALYGTINGRGNRQPSDLHAIASNAANRAEKVRDHNDKLRKAKRRLSGMQNQIKDLRTLKKKATEDDKARIRNLNRSLKDLRLNIKDLEEKTPDADYAMGVRDGKIGDTRLLHRGEIRNQGQSVKRGFLQVLDHVKAYPIGSRSSGRLQLASWLTQPDNPLTSRVMVNLSLIHI